MAIRKPKKLKLPKKPRANASPNVLQNYLKRKAEVEKKNRANEAAYKAAVKKQAALRKKVFG